MNCCNDYGRCTQGPGCPARTSSPVPITVDGPFFPRRRSARVRRAAAVAIALVLAFAIPSFLAGLLAGFLK